MFVSVIIPTFNRSKMVAEAVESVCDQKFQNKEIIIIDDGSTDDTKNVLKGFGSQVEYVYIENSGVSKARNIGIRRARGDLIAFLDSDDIWFPKKLQKQVEYFEENPDISICQTEEVWVRNGKRVNPKDIHKKHSGWIFKECIPRCIVSPSAVMIRRELFNDVGLFDESMPACEDYDLWLRISLKYQIITMPDPLIIKRGGHADQLSKQWGLDVWRIHALRKLLDNGLENPDLEDLVRKDVCRRAEIVIKGAVARGKLDLATEFQKMREELSPKL